MTTYFTYSFQYTLTHRHGVMASFKSDGSAALPEQFGGVRRFAQ